MPSFTNLLIVMAVAFSAPLVLGLFPRLQLPSVVLEIVPVLKDAGEISSTFGQLIIAAASIADFGAIILLSIFFSGEGGTGSTLLLLGSLFVLAAVVLGVVRGAERSTRIRADLLRLQDTTAQIRVRAALLLFVGFAAVADALGLEAILGAFIEGAVVSRVDRDPAMTHPD